MERHVGKKEGSPLFCTPPPEEIPASLDSVFGNVDEDQLAFVTGTARCPISVEDSRTFGVRTSIPDARLGYSILQKTSATKKTRPIQDIDGKQPRASPQDRICLPVDRAHLHLYSSSSTNIEYRQQPHVWKMSVTPNSLTSPGALTGGPLTADNTYPAKPKSVIFKPTFLSPTASKRVTVSNGTVKSNSTSKPSCQLVGYNTSEDEKEIGEQGPTADATRKKSLTKTPKSSAIVNTSDSGTSIHLPQQRDLYKPPTITPNRRGTISAATSKREQNSYISIDTAQQRANVGSNSASHTYSSMGTLNQVESREGRGLMTEKHSDSIQRRSVDIRRPQTKGGFILDSDDSEAEEPDHHDEAEEKRANVNLGTPDPRCFRKPLPALSGSVAKAPAAPTGQVNMARLNMLVSRNKAVNLDSKPNVHSNAPSRSPSTPFRQATTLPPGASGPTSLAGKPTSLGNVVHGKKQDTGRTAPLRQGSDTIANPSKVDEKPASFVKRSTQTASNTLPSSTMAHFKGNMKAPDTVVHGSRAATLPPGTMRREAYGSNRELQTLGTKTLDTSASKGPNASAFMTPSREVGSGHHRQVSYGSEYNVSSALKPQPRSTSRLDLAQAQAKQTRLDPQPRDRSLGNGDVSRQQTRVPSSAQTTPSTRGPAQVPRTQRSSTATTQVANKRKSDGITGGPSDSAAPFKKPALDDRNSPFWSRPVLGQQEDLKASTDLPMKSTQSTKIGKTPTKPTVIQLTDKEVHSGTRATPALAGRTTRETEVHPSRVRAMREQLREEPMGEANKGGVTAETSFRPPKPGLHVPTTASDPSLLAVPKTATKLERSDFPNISMSEASKVESRPEVGQVRTSEAVQASLSSVAVAASPSAIETEMPVVALPKSSMAKDAAAYFEYMISQKSWNYEEKETDIEAIDLLVKPFTNIDEANAQAEKLFQVTLKQYSQSILAASSSKRDNHGCLMLVGTFSPADYPSKMSYMKISVQRDFVSKLANQAPQTFCGTPLVSSAVYILRLFKLVDGPDTSDSEDSAPPQLRVHHCVARPELYTSLEAANRAARNLQIELSHQKNPGKGSTAAWQEQNIKELNAKITALNSITEGEGKYWKSSFNGSGRGGDRFELVVEQVGLCGPRNL
jgi:hypothetical protein